LDKCYSSGGHRAGIANRAKHVLNGGRGLLRGDAERRVFTGKLKGATARVRIGAIFLRVRSSGN
jgi:hypothetical protein